MSPSVIFCILSCRSYAHRQSAQIATWLQGQPHVYLSDTESETSVRLTDVQGYASNELKALAAPLWLIHNRPGYPYYFFCDDDTYVNVHKVNALLSDLPQSCGYGHVLSRESDPQNPCWQRFPALNCYLSGGAGYILPAQVLHALAVSTYRPPTTGYGDLSLGHCFQALGTPLVNISGFHKDRPGAYGHSPFQIADAYTYHYITPEEMARLHRVTG